MLFTDLVGSTDLLSQLGEAAFDEVRRVHFAALRDAVERTAGEEVKTLGDGVLAVFGSAADAVACAVAMQQAVDRQAGRAGVPLAIRVGLALGDVSFEEDDVFGTPVVEAARLAAAAGGGQILAASVVPIVAGGRSEARFTDLGLLELKGLPQPIPVCQVAWEPLPEPSVPLPALLTDLGRIFVAREDELARLEQLWKEAAAGERRLALLAGEPGVGKTRMAAELARTVHGEGATVLVGRSDEDLGVPFQPFVEALRHLVEHVAAGELRDRLGRYSGELVRLLPELSERLPDLPPLLRSDPETERYRLFDAVAAWLAAASAHQPVLLILDDLQWAAKPTLLLLRHVMRSPEPVRLLILGTYRDTELSHGHPLVEVLADFRRQAGVERLSLSGLDQAAVVSFMAQAAGHEMDDEGLALARAIHTETEGNPFFVREVLRHLTETGAIEQRDGRWATRLPLEELGIPEGVREVVGRRLSRLSNDANRVLRVAAVVGTEFELSVVGMAGDLDEEALLSALEEAIAARLVAEVPAPTPRHRFAHALVRDTLYGELSAARRVAVHSKVAEGIEALYAGALDDHLPALAHHWARASAPAAETTRAVDYAARAGDRALAQLAHDEAAAYYGQALELLGVAPGPPDEARRLELLISLGEAQRRAGDPAFRDTLLDAARLAQDRGDGRALARAALANSRRMVQSSVLQVDPERLAALEAALSVGVADSLERARLLADLGLELTASGDERRLGLSDEALAMARRLGDDGTLAHVLTARFYTLISPGTLATRRSDTAELVEVAERLGDPVAVVLARFVRARASTEHGDIEEARADLLVAERIAAELGQPTLRWYTTFARAGHLLLSGRMAEAEVVAREAGRLAEATSQPDGPIYLATQLFGVLSEHGRLEELEGVWIEVVQRFPEATYPRAMLALLLAEIDRTVEAEALLQDLATSDFALIPVNNLWLLVMTSLSVVATRTGDKAGSAALYELIAPYADQIAGVAVLWVGSVSHYLGLLGTTLGRFDEAEARFAAAEATHERIGAPTWLARTRLEWARMLLARGQAGGAERARELLGQALATARELGLGNVERRGVALLR